MHTDPIADLLTRIRNAINAHHNELEVPYSKIKAEILRVMKEREFILDYKVEENGSFQVLKVTLDENKKITLTRKSKPGQRIYVKSDELKILKSGLGISIISTSKGVMTNAQAKKEKLGGELICEIY